MSLLGGLRGSTAPQRQISRVLADIRGDSVGELVADRALFKDHLRSSDSSNDHDPSPSQSPKGSARFAASSDLLPGELRYSLVVGCRPKPRMPSHHSKRIREDTESTLDGWFPAVDMSLSCPGAPESRPRRRGESSFSRWNVQWIPPSLISGRRRPPPRATYRPITAKTTRRASTCCGKKLSVAPGANRRVLPRRLCPPGGFGELRDPGALFVAKSRCAYLEDGSDEEPRAARRQGAALRR